MSVLSDTRIKRIKTIKQNEFDEQFIREFYRDWNVVRKLVETALKRYEKMYRIIRISEITLTGICGIKKTPS